MDLNNKTLRFGTGGVPLSTESRDTLSGIGRIRELGLEHMEIEFVHGVRMGREKAKEVGDLARELNITLTIHAPYYINLNALDPKKRMASRQRIVESCEIGEILGAKSVCFHAAFNLGQDSGQVFEMVLSEMILIEEELEKLNLNNIWLAPEVTGKKTQFGSLEELVALAKNLERTRLCIDFAHYFAREAGQKNHYDDFRGLLCLIKHELGLEVAQKLHMHFSGIEYSAKGEKNHLKLEHSHFNWQGMIKALRDEGIGGYMVCESPILEQDALRAKEYYDKL